MSLKTGQLNLEMAITAWKTLWLEASTNQDRADKVWRPTQELLDRMSVKPPTIFTCFAGKQYMFPGDSYGVAVKLFFIGENNAAYLGTLLNDTANQEDRKREISRLNLINKKLAKKLASADILAIVRDSLFCRIPADSDVLDAETAVKAVKRYLATLAPALSGCKIVWLLKRKALAIERQIRFQAEKTAKPATKEEHYRATAEDELELWL